MKDIDTKKFILKRLVGIETEIKDINKNLIPVCTIIKGNGKSLPDQVEDNTTWRNEMSGALKLVYILVGSTWAITILRLLKVI